MAAEAGGVTEIEGATAGFTVTVVDAVLLLPATSTTVAVTRNVPSLSKRCVAVVALEMAPRLSPLPSPQLTETSRTALPPVASVTVKVNDAV